MTLTVLEPTPPPRSGISELAPRLRSLAGATIAFVDGWGRHTVYGDHMYPLMKDLERRLTSECGVKACLWYPKESIAKGLSEPRMTELITRANAAVVGEAI